MSSGSVAVPSGQAVAPLNFIYACSVCCYALADVYDGNIETVQGLSDGISPRERLVTHLWLASCCHVFCSSHLDGGAPEFHPEGQRPKAPCPVCIREKSDHAAKDLYSIRGFRKNEYDPMIPAAWFNAPPVTLDGNGRELEALRFQYLALVRYCQNTHATRKPLQDALTQAEEELGKMRNLASEKHDKVLSLQQEVKELRRLETAARDLEAEVERREALEHELDRYRRLDVNPRDLAMFKDNKDAIKQYLELIPGLIDQNTKMKERLAMLGFAMPLEPVPNLKAVDLSAFESSSDGHGISSAKQRETTSSHTAGRSAHALGEATTPSSPDKYRPSKRPRLGSSSSGNMRVDPPNSRDQMPPPQKPVSRIPSIRKIIPSLRRKFGSRRHLPIPQTLDDQTIEEGGQSENFIRDVSENDNRPLMRHGYDEDALYMSGALPVETSSHFSGSSNARLLPSLGYDNDNVHSTLPSSSPTKMSRQMSAQLPVLPSYIRLMDGLSHGDDVELGLKDPRKSPSLDYQSFDRRTRTLADTSGRWGYHAPRDNEKWSPRKLHRPQQLEQTSYPAGSLSDFSPRDAGERSPVRWQHKPPMETTQPCFRRNQQSNHPMENMVSSSKMNGYSTSPPFAKTGSTELQASSIRSGAYRSERGRTSRSQNERLEPCSLNGLSFFETPLNPRGQPIDYSHDQQEASCLQLNRPYKSRHLDSNGIFVRPRAGASPFFHESAFDTTRNQTASSWQQQSHPDSAANFPSFGHSSSPQRSRLPAAMPSIVSGWSSLHSQPQGLNRQRPGARSIRNQVNTVGSGRFSSLPRNMLSSVGRRSVKR